MSSHERAHHDEANNVTYQRCQFAYEFAKPFINGKKYWMLVAVMLMELLWCRIRFWDYRFGLRWSDDWSKQESICIDPESEFSTCYNSSFANCGSVLRCDYIVPVHRTYSSPAEFIRECIRVLKPGGKCSLQHRIIRCHLRANPFHDAWIYLWWDEAGGRGDYFFLWIAGTGMEIDRVNKHYEENGKFVRMILKWDVFKLHQRLPWHG